MTTATAMATDARPPLLLVRLMNPVMRMLLRTPIGRLIRPCALLEFHGRRSGRRFLVPVGYHDVNGERMVFTPAPWRSNFAGGRTVTVWFRGRHDTVTGTLVDDPAVVAQLLRGLATARGGSLSSVGVKVPPGHEVSAADVIAVDRAAIRFS
jgi:hypothetical protein